MKKEEIGHFEEILSKKRKEILEELQDTEKKIRVSQQDSTSELSLCPIHSADIATDAETIEEEAFFVGNRSHLLEEIEYALKKISRGRYGICEDCGKEIEKKRLLHLPYARYCIKCMEEREK